MKQIIWVHKKIIKINNKKSKIDAKCSIMKKLKRFKYDSNLIIQLPNKLRIRIRRVYSGITFLFQIVDQIVIFFLPRKTSSFDSSAFVICLL